MTANLGGLFDPARAASADHLVDVFQRHAAHACDDWRTIRRFDGPTCAVCWLRGLHRHHAERLYKYGVHRVCYQIATLLASSPGPLPDARTVAAESTAYFYSTIHRAGWN